jgi:hypothetical protein
VNIFITECLIKAAVHKYNADTRNKLFRRLLDVAGSVNNTTDKGNKYNHFSTFTENRTLKI